MKLEPMKNIMKKPAFLYSAIAVAILAGIIGLIWVVAQIGSYLDG